MFKIGKKTLEVIDDALVPVLLTLSIFWFFYSVSIVDFEQANFS